MRHVLSILFAVVILTPAKPQAQSAMDARVSVAFQNAPAPEVLGGLARGAGVGLQVDPGALHPVTITLTNVKLTNALNAICDSASCTWKFDGGLRVTPLPLQRNATLPAYVSFRVSNARARDVLSALAEALGIPVMMDPALDDRQTVNWVIEKGATAEVLNVVCKQMNCRWDFDATSGILRFSPKP